METIVQKWTLTSVIYLLHSDYRYLNALLALPSILTAYILSYLPKQTITLYAWGCLGESGKLFSFAIYTHLKQVQD